MSEKEPVKVLHVDDEAGFLKVAQKCLEIQRRFEVDIVLSVEEAVEMMEKKAYDAIVCDYRMPGKDGLEFLKQLRERGDNIPFIMFTGKGREEIALKALNYGADQYLSKSGDPEMVYCELAHAVCKAVERKRIEDQLRLNSLILENIDDSIIVTDLEGRITFWNKGAAQIFGYSANEMLGKTIARLCKPEERKHVAAVQLEHLRKGIVFSGEWEGVRKNGEHVWLMLTSKLLKNSQGETAGMVGVGKDITKYKQLEEALKESEENYRNMVELAPLAIVTVDLKGVITSCNRFVALSGYSKDEIVGKHFSKIGWLQLRDLPKHLKLFSSLIRGKVPEPFELNYKHKDGEPHVGEVFVSLMKKHGKITGIQAILRDITEYKKKQKALFESEEKFKQLFMENPEAAVYTDANFNVLDVNTRFTDLFGYSLKELKGRYINDFVAPPDKIKEAKMLDRNVRKEDAYQEDTVRKRKDGTLIPVSISAASIVVEGRHVGYVGVYKDISKLKKTEKRLKETLEKLNVVGRLTRHDLRNKLTSITGNVFLAKRDAADQPDLVVQLSEIESACSKILRIFDFASTYEQLGVEELTYVDVAKAVDEATSLLPDPNKTKIVNECQGLTVRADSLLRQLFYNLMDNSLKHGEKVKQIRIHYEAGNDQVTLVYEDNGAGIPNNIRKNLFKEGYGRHTGYGLYLIKKICEVYGWHIEETGKPGRGSQFTMIIPQNSHEGEINYKLSQ
ncbi:MAG: PAS domain S-box protein [Candidatus Bathyarchaeia archaeon]